MENFNYDNKSLICQFNINRNSISIICLLDTVETLFIEFGYTVKKFFYSKKGKIYSTEYNKFKSKINSFDDISGISLQSDFKSKDFEPNAKIDVEINLRYIKSKEIIKLSVILNDISFCDSAFFTYKRIITILSQNNNLNLSGYSFFLSNYYGPVSFATGILRKMNMSRSLKNLAGWYSSSDIENGTICLLNCFSNLNESQNHHLENVFGEENLFKSNGISAFYNRFAEGVDISDYLISSNYNLICNSIEKRVPFKRLHFYKEI